MQDTTRKSAQRDQGKNDHYKTKKANPKIRFC